MTRAPRQTLNGLSCPDAPTVHILEQSLFFLDLDGPFDGVCVSFSPFPSSPGAALSGPHHQRAPISLASHRDA